MGVQFDVQRIFRRRPFVFRHFLVHGLRAAEALASLDARSREIVVLRVYEEKSYQEIADETGLPVGTVGYMLHEALQKLARALRSGKEVHP